MRGRSRVRWWMVAGALFLLAALLFLVRNAPWNGGRDKVWARCQREGVVRVGMDASYPPFETEQAGAFSGYDVDLAQEIGRRLGLRVEFVNVTLDGLYDALAAGRCDILISGLTYEAQRTQDVSYTGGYFGAGQVLVVRADDERIRTLGDLVGKQVAVEMGSTAHQEARLLLQQKGISLRVHATNSAEDALDLVQNGAADAAVADAVTARLGVHARAGLKVWGAPLTDESFVIAVRKDSPGLFDAVNGALGALRQEGWLEQLTERWL